jgi:anthranilate phosphoribosyltransferase
MSDFKAFIAKVADGATLTAEAAQQAFDVVMSGDATPSQIGGFLMALRVRGETVDEITGAVRTMRSKMTRVDAPADAIDIVGTGGDGAGTFNISTCSAIVAAGAGLTVAKHGNRALSSRAGAADALMALGVNIDVAPDTIARCIREAGVGFMFAPAHHAAMRHVGPTRVELGTRTVFNLLGPISNPAGTKRQLVGVFSRDWVEPLAHVFKNLGAERVWVVHGSDGLDELTTTGPSHVAELKDGEVATYEVSPGDAGLPLAGAADLKGGDAQFNADAIRSVLAGVKTPFRDIVAYTTAAALLIADKVADLKEGAAMAQDAIDSGRAKIALDTLVRITNG